MQRTMIIIGAGTAGLAAGCYAQMNGYQATIVEMEDTPGGLCTSWKRKGYLFDASVAGLAGSAPGSPLYQLWEELGVTKYCPLHYGENFGHIRLLDGRVITVYANIDRMETHLLDCFPAEAAVIRDFTGALRSVLDLDIPFSDAQGWKAVKEGLKTFVSSLSHLPVLLKYGSMTIRQFNHKIQDPALATVFNNLVHFGGVDVPILTVLLPLAYAHRKMAGIPLRGWLSFARSIERRFLELGGQIQYRAKVEHLIVESGAAKGVVLADGTQLLAERVVSAADGRFTQSLMPGVTEGDLQRAFKSQELSDQPVQVNLGAAMDFSRIDGPMTYILERPFTAAGREHSRMTVHNKYHDADAAPQGKSALTVFLDSSYDWWQQIAAQPDRYRAEKERCAQQVIQAIEQYHSGFAACVEVIDVATPLTRERYTGNWMGAMQARKPNSNMIQALMQGSPRYAVKGVTGLYVTGQWAEAWGGITTAAQSGRKAIQAMCKQDDIVFRTSRPGE